MDENCVIVKGHRNDVYSSIVSKTIYPVAFNPLENRKTCKHEKNIRSRKYFHSSVSGKYKFKDVVYCKSSFVDLDVYVL